MKNKSKILDLIILISIIVISTFIILYFQVKPCISTIFHFIIPSMYLILREKKNLKKILLASSVFGLIFGIPLSLIATFNNAWFIPSSQLFFPWRIFGLSPIDEIIWFFFWVFFIITFYEHFLDDEKNKAVSKNLKYALFLSLLVLLITLIIFLISPEILKFHYAYLILGIAIILPLICLSIKKPNFIYKFSLLVIFFFFLHLILELTALKLGYLGFYGEYIGNVELFNLKFPFEEFIFWIVLSAATIVSCYEIFIDDEK